ncbi:group 2 major outer membrane porin protein PorA [Campylobacter jejuni]|nr:group 2 major outer membrane porin protein PorA [Campylobacter jejuni]EGV1496305.1 group 2 major outer membrane porin protein PorA [Campylobacter jejuni]EHD2481062.1 group 2 major outer membrane porin protein PorA [Campylobacter jejuni]EHM4177025.1 group 2 major outer membrane porin protein PorA [Campylobacter jejuni]EIO6975572.1 group 2 major outer membrane porin protein PorA [Campylobacter jejuni]
MKLVKLSLVAALAASAFSAANATPLEEAIKDIDVSGVLRYRYESSNPWSNANFGSGISGKQDHKYRAQVNFSGAISDNFKAFVQFDYNSQDGGYGTDSISNTSDTLTVRQLYLTYTNEDVATSVIAGKQQLNTIWTDNGIDGLVGTGVKVVNNSIDGLTLAAFAMDSFNEASDTTVTITQDDSQKITGVQFNRGNPKGDSDVSGALDWSKNIYGAAAIGSYDIAGGQFNPQLWLAYMSDNAFLYALDAAYSTTIFDGINWTIEGAYLGNSVDNKLKDRLDAANGNFFALRGTVEVNGWDASLGGLYYGKKDKITVTTIEDQGNLGSLLAGEEIFYTRGSNLNGDLGRNIFGYVTGGYTFNEAVRVGADFVYGGTKTNIIGQGGKKLEAVARVDYKYSPKLNFSAFYSYVNVDTDPESTHHDAVKLQALYKF